jgi:hypothetical protein
MTDAQFIRDLEDCRLPAGGLDHAAHVRAGYLFLRAHEFPQALHRLRRAIRTYAASLGKADLYHETITVAFLALIQQRMCERGDGGDWTVFQRENPELLDRALLLHYYARAQLDSPLARRVFVLPVQHAAGGRDR